MSEVLRSYEDIVAEHSYKYLAEQLHDLIMQRPNPHVLLLRNLANVAVRYGMLNDRSVKTNVMQDTWTRKSKSFAIVDSKNKIKGAASVVYNSRRPHRLHLPIKYNRFFLPITSPQGRHPHISAWIDHSNPDNLELVTPAYEELVKVASESTNDRIKPRPWTLEPEESPPEIQEAILAVRGLHKVGTYYYDDFEGRLFSPARLATLHEACDENLAEAA